MDADPTCGELIHLAHHAASDPNLWNQVALRLRSVLRARVVGFFEHNLVTRQGDIPNSAGLGEDYRPLYRSRFAARNVWLNVPRDCEPGKTLTGAELVPNWELVQTEFYRGWLRPQNICHALIGIVSRSAEELRCLIALRPLDGPPFGGADRTLLARLLPDLQCACRLSAEFASNQRLTQVCIDLLEALPEATMVVDNEARPIILNRSAELLLARNDGLALANGAIAAVSAQQTAYIRHVIADASRGADGSRSSGNEIVIERPSGAPPLLVRITSLPHPLADRSGRSRSVAAVLTRPVEAPDSTRRLCRFYRMTAAEERLAILIVNGRSLLGAAAELRITKNTARTHMKRIYAKTDTHRQVDLVRLLAVASSLMAEILV